MHIKFGEIASIGGTATDTCPCLKTVLANIYLASFAYILNVLVDTCSFCFPKLILFNLSDLHVIMCKPFTDKKNYT